jgi:hypothetical protein
LKSQVPESINRPCVIAVEGDDCKRVVRAMLRHLQRDAVVRDLKSQSEIRSGLLALATDPGFVHNARSLAVIIDAEANIVAAIDKAKGAIAQLQDWPHPTKHGVIRSHPSNLRRAGFFVLPDGKSNGNLEDLVWRSVADNPMAPCIQDFQECIHENGLPLPSNLSKFRVQSFIAGHPSDFRLIGEAADGGVWPFDHDAFDGLRKFLSGL